MVIIKKFTLNKNMNQEMDRYLWKTGKCIETSRKYFIMGFDDELDYLAFCVGSGIMKMENIDGKNILSE